jgi:hypothetical protein
MVPGTPHALPAGTVDGQLSQLLAWLNGHVGAPAGAHPASAIAATPHAYIEGTSVQAQLQEIVGDLASQVVGSAGASRVGAEAVSGMPDSLPAGTVASQVAGLLSAINAHLIDTTAAHPAGAIAVADPGANFDATNVEDALAEVADAFEADHFRGDEPDAGQHRAIHQPALGVPSDRVLLWDSVGVGSPRGRLRVYADYDDVWFVQNASWNGTAWARDSVSNFAGGFRFSRAAFVLLHDNTFTATFTDWARTWTLPMSASVNTGFETTGTVREVGRLGMESCNPHSSPRAIALGGAQTFRSRFPATPSSITFSVTSSGNFSGTPNLWDPDRDGFGYYGMQTVSPTAVTYWFGTYTAIA